MNLSGLSPQKKRGRCSYLIVFIFCIACANTRSPKPEDEKAVRSAYRRYTGLVKQFIGMADQGPAKYLPILRQTYNLLSSRRKAHYTRIFSKYSTKIGVRKNLEKILPDSPFKNYAYLMLLTAEQMKSKGDAYFVVFLYETVDSVKQMKDGRVSLTTINTLDRKLFRDQLYIFTKKNGQWLIDEKR